MTGSGVWAAWSSAVDAAALATAVAAVVVGALAWLVTRSLHGALPLLLDLLLAAGLLRLSTELSWRGVGGAALVVVVRHVADAGLRRHMPLPLRGYSPVVTSTGGTQEGRPSCGT